MTQLDNTLAGPKHKVPDKPASALKPLEIADYRLNPLDGVLEKKMIIANEAHWPAALPDDVVPTVEPGRTWRK